MGPSKQVSRELLESMKVASSALEQADPIAAMIEKELAPFVLEGEPRVEWRQLQILLGRRLKANSEGLRQADDSLNAVGITSKQLRQQRYAAVLALRRELRRVRFLLDESLPKEDALALFPERGRLNALDPTRLAALGRTLVALLREREAQARLLRDADNLPNPEALVQTVEAAIHQLEAVLEALVPRDRQHERTFDQRKQERLATQESWRRTRDLLVGLYRVAGFDYLAAQLRGRKRSKKADEVMGEETTGEMPPHLPTTPEKEEVTPTV